VIAARAVALAVPALGDCCLLDLADGHGGLVRAAEAHAGPGRHVVVTPAGKRFGALGLPHAVVVPPIGRQTARLRQHRKLCRRERARGRAQGIGDAVAQLRVI